MRIISFRTRHARLAKYFREDEGICYCIHIDNLMQDLETQHDPNEWRLLIDSDKESLKCVLLHIGNVHPSAPLAHAFRMTKSYDCMETLLTLNKYEEHQWNICEDLKVEDLLLGLHMGYTKYKCYLCMWDSRDDKHHYVQEDWSLRTNHVIGKQNVQRKAHADRNKIYLPPLNIKLGIVKYFVKAMDFSGFKYIQKKCGAVLRGAKLKVGIFVGSQVRELICDSVFEIKLSRKEKPMWKALVDVIECFLGS